MPRYAALLRGVNVGGHRAVPMADLRKLLEELGYSDVATYLQSGNAVLTADDEDPQRVTDTIRQGLARRMAVDADVLVRTGPELNAVIEDNPFADAVEQPTKLHVAFLATQPDPADVAKVDPATYAPDEFRFGDRVVYLRYAVSAGRSKLGDGALARLGVVATSRNWNTVLALARMTEQNAARP